jgi:tetratricopeptide (TPR) repeat protein
VRSIVPLAQCLLHDTDPANDKEAEQLLLSAVDGSELAPEAPEFRAGLIELGRLFYETKRYDEAIRRVTEAIERFPADREIDALRYRQADAYRLSAAMLEQQVEGRDGAMAETERQEKEAARRDRLRRAVDAYEQVRQSLEARDQATLSELDRVQLRNTMFYLGDCPYDLGDFTTAINNYDAARQRYPSEPASLVAMVQIVNAYVEQHEWAKARTANESAKRHLARLPADVWSSPDMPMERKHWERWLNSSTLLEQHSQAEN